MFLELNQMIDSKWLSFNESQYRNTRIIANDITTNNRNLSSRIDQLSENINNTMQRMNTLETSSNGQTTKVSSIESRLSTVSRQLNILESEFDKHSPR